MPATASVRLLPEDHGAGASNAASGISPEMATAFAQIMSSLEALTNNCRSHGMDPMTMLSTMMSRGSGFTPSQTTIPAVIRADVRAAALTPTDAEIARRSHDLIDALDRGDVAAVEAALAPGFVHFEGGPSKDRDVLLAKLNQRTSNVPYIVQRTWDNECVVRKADALVFTGKACELGNDAHGGYAYDGWYLLQWVRSGDSWRVQLLTWQRASTERDWWNDTFLNGRGFSREPNRLLVESVEDENPGAALEIAAGQGRNALYLASRGWKVTAVDISDEGLRIARDQAAKRNLEIETVNANINEWDFGENRFDLVTLLYMGGELNCIDKIKKGLRKGGLFVVEGWAREPGNPAGLAEGQLSTVFSGYEILHDEIVDDVPDWTRDQGKLARFVARKI